jgi:phospholipid/cholesterol/gamma-HCH transport system permease protein
MGQFLIHAVLAALTPPIKIRRAIKQIHFIGWQSMTVIVLTGGFTGMVLALQGFHSLKRVGSEAFLGPLVALSLIRELGPVIAALMVTGRAGSAITAEIGVMRISDQIDAIELMGLNPMRYLVVPNLIAAIISMPLLAAIFDLVGIYGGYLVGVKILGLSTGTYFGEITTYLDLEDIVGGLYKALSFGVILAWICCFKGYYTYFGAEGVSRSTTEAVVLTSVLILVWDYFMTAAVF